MLELLRLITMLTRLSPYWSGSLEQIKRRQERRFRRLLHVAMHQSPFYAKSLAGIDIERCSVRDLPILTKSELMKNFDDLLTVRDVKRAEIEHFMEEPTNLGKFLHGRYGISHTSGSQGQPALIVQDPDALALTFAVQFARGTTVGYPLLPQIERLWNPARVAVLTQQPGFYPSGAAFGYLPTVLAPYFKMLRLSVFDSMARNVDALNEFCPEYIIGYTSALEALGREESAGRLKLGRTGDLKQITNISEPMPEPSAVAIENAFGAHVYNEYAMGECMALTSGCRCSHGSHVNIDLAILEVVDEDGRTVPDGTSGHKVLVTNLYNTVQPFIRYEVGDVITMKPGPCLCGSTFPLIESVGGRTADKFWIKINGGYREIPYYLFLAALHHELGLSEHQVLQTGANTFLIRVCPQLGQVLSAERLRRLVAQSVRDEGLASFVKFEVEIVAELARGPSGKVARAKNLFGPPPYVGTP